MIEGWGSFILKEKLKALKCTLKQWGKDVFGDMDAKINATKIELNELDARAEEGEPNESEGLRRKSCWGTLMNLIKAKDSFLYQKSRVKWIREGDANTAFFHKCSNKNRKRNEILGIEVEGQWLQVVEEVKHGIKGHFRKRRDKWEWKHGNKGIYLTKAAYQQVSSVLLEQQEVDEDAEYFARKIWNIIIPNKVAAFVWRV